MKKSEVRLNVAIMLGRLCPASGVRAAKDRFSTAGGGRLAPLGLLGGPPGVPGVIGPTEKDTPAEDVGWLPAAACRPSDVIRRLQLYGLLDVYKEKVHNPICIGALLFDCKQTVTISSIRVKEVLRVKGSLPFKKSQPMLCVSIGAN